MFDIVFASLVESNLDTTNVAAWSTSVPLAIHLLRRGATSVLPPAVASTLRKRCSNAGSDAFFMIPAPREAIPAWIPLAREAGVLYCSDRAAPLPGSPSTTSSGPCVRAATRSRARQRQVVEREAARLSLPFYKCLGVPVINTGTCHRAYYLQLVGPWQGGCSPPLSQSPEAEEIGDRGASDEVAVSSM